MDVHFAEKACEYISNSFTIRGSRDCLSVPKECIFGAHFSDEDIPHQCVLERNLWTVQGVLTALMNASQLDSLWC